MDRHLGPGGRRRSTTGTGTMIRLRKRRGYVMANVDTAPGRAAEGTAETDYEVVVIGAGVAGIYQIKRLLDLGVHALVLDANADLGGTWYMNRYPGARFDSESYTYGYSWDQELLDEWHWTERF